MKSATLLPPLRLYEWAFGLFLLVTSLRLAAAGALGLGLEFGAMSASVAAVAGLARWHPCRATDVARLLWLPLLIGISYVRIGPAVAAIGTTPFDEALLWLDRAVLGETPALAWVGWNHPILTELMSACYFLYYPAMLAAFATGLLWKSPHGERFFNGLITIHAIGFLGYTLIPAAGPHLAWAELLPPPAQGWRITHLNGMMVAGSNRVDVFPSLHTAVTLFLMGILWRWQRPWFFVFILPAAGLCMATLYLRYHYAIDLLAGAALAAFGLWLASRPDHRHQRED